MSRHQPRSLTSALAGITQAEKGVAPEQASPLLRGCKSRVPPIYVSGPVLENSGSSPVSDPEPDCQISDNPSPASHVIHLSSFGNYTFANMGN